MTETDCRCSICGSCKHDHGGWNHEWTPKTPPEPECDHLLTYVTPISGLEGLYWRCRDCTEYWRMNPYEDFPQRYAIGVDQSINPIAVATYRQSDTGEWEHLGYTEADGVGVGLEDEPDDWGYDSNGNVVDLR